MPRISLLLLLIWSTGSNILRHNFNNTHLILLIIKREGDVDDINKDNNQSNDRLLTLEVNNTCINKYCSQYS